MLAYVDASAMVKLVVEEAESVALAEAVRGNIVISSALLRTELRRAIARRDDAEALIRAELLLLRTKLVSVGDELWDSAGRLTPPQLRSLGALHVATALMLGPRVDAVVTYDVRMAEAARMHRLMVLSPGRDG